MTERLCPRCNSDLVATATPADQTPTPGRLDRLECPAMGCGYQRPVVAIEADYTPHERRALQAHVATAIEQIARGAVDADAAVKKGEADPEAIAQWAAETAGALVQLAALCKAVIAIKTGATMPLDVHIAVGPEAIAETPAPEPPPPPFDRVAAVIEQVEIAAGEARRGIVIGDRNVEALITWARETSTLAAELADELYRGMP